MKGKITGEGKFVKKRVFILVTRFLFLTGLFAVSSLYGATALRNRQMPLMDVRGAPSSALENFCDLCGGKNTDTWNDILKITEEWLVSTKDTKNGVWPSPCRRTNIHELYDVISALHSSQVVPAYYASYDSAVILGGNLASIRQRLFFLKQEWERGVVFKEIIFVTGDRPRFEGLENESLLLDPGFVGYIISPAWSFDGFLPRNEKEIAEFVWAQMEIPKEWREGQVKVSFVEAKNNEKNKFATRRDFLRAWLAECPFRKKVLFVSSQPYIGLDSLLISQEFSSEKFIFDTVGPGFSISFLNTERGLGICCEAIAKWVYALKK